MAELVSREMELEAGREPDPPSLPLQPPHRSVRETDDQWQGGSLVQGVLCRGGFPSGEGLALGSSILSCLPLSSSVVALGQRKTQSFPGSLYLLVSLSNTHTHNTTHTHCAELRVPLKLVDCC